MYSTLFGFLLSDTSQFIGEEYRTVTLSSTAPLILLHLTTTPITKRKCCTVRPTS